MILIHDDVRVIYKNYIEWKHFVNSQNFYKTQKSFCPEQCMKYNYAYLNLQVIFSGIFYRPPMSQQAHNCF